MARKAHGAAQRQIVRPIDLKTWKHVRQQTNERPLWAPNECWKCSDTYTRPADGRDPDDKSRKCPYCQGTGYGPQYRAYISRVNELLLGGSRGGGKSASAIAHLFKGNPHKPHYTKEREPILVNQSYLHSPHYRALILRRDAVDLDAFVAEAKKYFTRFGGHWVGGSEAKFKFDSGAIIWTGHLKNQESYEKYLGVPELHRIVIEELTLIPNEDLYMMIRSNLRSVHEELEPQLLATTNPPGVGKQWVMARFVEVPKPDGGMYEWGEVIRVPLVDPYTGEKEIRTRQFIPARLIDNPYLMRNKDYRLNLEELPPGKKEAYLYGDWHGTSDSYFFMFRNPLRQNLEHLNEPKNACHVVTREARRKALAAAENGDGQEWRRLRLEDWYPRAIGVDIGFTHETAITWGCLHPETGQYHVYREMLFEKTAFETIGVEMARACVDELNKLPSHKMTVWISPDSFWTKSDDIGSVAPALNVAWGIAQALGPNGVSIPDLPEPGPSVARQEEFRRGWVEFYSNLRTRQESGLVIKRAVNAREFGFQWMQQLMLWEEPKYDTLEFDEKRYQEIFRQFGAVSANRYREACSRQNIVYPRLQIHEECKRLIDALPLAMADDNNPESVSKDHFRGADSIESCRYLLTGMQKLKEETPPEVIADRRLAEFQLRNPNASGQQLVQFNRHLEQQMKKEARPACVKIGRRATARRRAAAGRLK